jgi:hypothetical protein
MGIFELALITLVFSQLRSLQYRSTGDHPISSHGKKQWQKSLRYNWPVGKGALGKGGRARGPYIYYYTYIIIYIIIHIIIYIVIYIIIYMYVNHYPNPKPNPNPTFNLASIWLVSFASLWIWNVPFSIVSHFFAVTQGEKTPKDWQKIAKRIVRPLAIPSGCNVGILERFSKYLAPQSKEIRRTFDDRRSVSVHSVPLVKTRLLGWGRNNEVL